MSLSTNALQNTDRLAQRAFRRPWGDTKLRPADWLMVLGGYPALLLILFVSQIGPGHIVSASEGDIAYYWQWQRHLLNAVLHGEMNAALNPYIMAGTPFLGALQSAVFYPLNALQLVFSVPVVLNIQVLLHWWLALVGFHVLGRELGWRSAAATFSALVGAFSGWAVLHFWQGHAPFVMEMAITPWVLKMWFRRLRGACSGLGYVLIVALLVAIQFSIGHPQIVYFTLVLMAWFAVGWLWVGRASMPLARWATNVGLTALGIALGLGLLAVQAIPTWLHMRETVRGARNVSEAYYTAQSMPWLNLFTLVAPWVWGGWPGRDNYFGGESMWEVVGFTGAVGMMLALLFFLRPRSLSRFQVLLGLLWVFGILLALGEYSGIYPWLRSYVPGLGIFRNPGRALFLVTVATALLAGEGFERAWLLAKSERAEFLSLLSRGWIFIGWCVAAILILFSDGIRSPIFMQMLLARTSREVVGQLTRPEVVRLFQNFQVNLVGAGMMAGLGLALMSRFLWKRYSGVAAWGVVGLLAFELTQFARPYMVSFNPELYEWSGRTRKFLQDNAQRYRITSIRTPADLNQGMRWEVRHVWGYEPTVALRYASAIAVSQGRPPGFPEAWLNVYRITPLINSLGVKYLIAPPKADMSRYGWRLVMDSTECSIHENTGALARGFVVGNALVKDESEIESYVNSADFEPTSTVVLAKADGDVKSTSATLRRANVTVEKDAPDEFVATVDCDTQAWFVLMDQMLPGWHVEINGSPSRVHLANAVGMAVEVPAGKSRVRFYYREPGLRAGLTITGVSALIYLGLASSWFIGRRKRRA